MYPSKQIPQSPTQTHFKLSTPFEVRCADVLLCSFLHSFPSVSRVNLFVLILIYVVYTCCRIRRTVVLSDLKTQNTNPRLDVSFLSTARTPLQRPPRAPLLLLCTNLLQSRRQHRPHSHPLLPFQQHRNQPILLLPRWAAMLHERPLRTL